jgi:hypothetical protein
MKRETRHFNNFEVRAESVNGQTKIGGYAAVFNQPTDLGLFTESIAPGAFSQSIQRDDVACLVNHDPNQVVARTPKTLALSEDDKGLLYEAVPADTQIGRDLIENVKVGNIRGSSFGFYIEEETIDKSKDKPHFTITRAKLFDVSPVTYPAYKQTSVWLERSLDEQTEILRERLALYLKNEEVAKILYEQRARVLNFIKFSI